MDHAVSEAAVAVDDLEGFWTQGRDLTAAELVDLNDRIARGHANVVAAREGGRWLITFGRGFTYMVLPILTCASCGQTVYVEEMPARYEPVHTTCFDPAEWDWRG
jgi:hypothetical protein